MDGGIVEHGRVEVNDLLFDPFSCSLIGAPWVEKKVKMGGKKEEEKKGEEKKEEDKKEGQRRWEKNEGGNELRPRSISVGKKKRKKYEIGKDKD